MKTVRIFSDRIRDRIRLEGFRSVHIRVRIFNIRHRIRIRILKSHIYDVDIQSYPIRHGWHYSYSNPNPDRNMKTNVISMISVRIRSVFIPSEDIQVRRIFDEGGKTKVVFKSLKEFQIQEQGEAKHENFWPSKKGKELRMSRRIVRA